MPTRHSLIIYEEHKTRYFDQYGCQHTHTHAVYTLYTRCIHAVYTLYTRCIHKTFWNTTPCLQNNENKTASHLVDFVWIHANAHEFTWLIITFEEFQIPTCFKVVFASTGVHFNNPKCKKPICPLSDCPLFKFAKYTWKHLLATTITDSTAIFTFLFLVTLYLQMIPYIVDVWHADMPTIWNQWKRLSIPNVPNVVFCSKQGTRFQIQACLFETKIVMCTRVHTRVHVDNACNTHIRVDFSLRRIQCLQYLV
jgi:hypothetical protein